MMLCCNLGQSECRFEPPGNCKVILSSRADLALRDGAVALAPDTAVVLDKGEARFNV
jgi:hypothetical protein